MKQTQDQKVIISKSAVQTIVRLAAEEVESVYNFAKPANKNERFFKVNISQGEAKVNICVSFYYGYNLKEEIIKLQENIKNSVETMLGITVDKVNVYVYDIILGQEH